MKALESRVIVKVSKGALKEKIGSFEVTTKDYEEAEVIAVGPKVENCEKGDKVYIYPNSGKRFNLEGEEYRTVALSEIIVVL